MGFTGKQTLIAIGIGGITGLFSGLTGIGGGAILVALMVSWLGLGQHTAQGTTPAIIIPVALFGAATYGFQGMNGVFEFSLPLAMTIIPALVIPSIFGVVIGATWMSMLPAQQLKRAFGIFLFFVAFSMLSKDVLPFAIVTSGSITVPFIFWILLGFVTGVFAGFLGIGGAIVLVPFMSLGAGMPQHMAQGITLAVVSMTSIAGAYAHYRLGNVSGRAVLAVAPVATLSVIGASLLAGQIDGFWLAKIFGVAMAFFGYQFTFVTVKEKPRNADPAVGFYNI